MKFEYVGYRPIINTMELHLSKEKDDKFVLFSICL